MVALGAVAQVILARQQQLQIQLEMMVLVELVVRQQILAMRNIRLTQAKVEMGAQVERLPQVEMVRVCIELMAVRGLC
jgi:hypothetical protein